MIMYIILFGYAINGFLFVISNQVKSISKEASYIDLDADNNGFVPADQAYEGKDGAAFDLAVGLESSKAVDPKIGTLVITHVKEEQGKATVETSVDIEKCKSHAAFQDEGKAN